PPADQVNSARVAVMNAENSLAAANNSLTQLQIGLTDENRRILVEAYRQLYIARDKLAADKARQASPETIADDEAAVLRALRVVETAEANTNYPNAGVTAQQLRTAETAVETARITLESNRLKLDKLLNPSASDINAAGAKVASAQATLASAQAKLNTLLHPTSADLAAAESAVTSAQAKLDLLRNPSPGDLAAAQASVASAQANLQNAQNNLNKLLNPSEADQAAARASALQSESQLNKTRIPYTEADLNAQRAAVDQALAQLSKTSTPSTALDIAKSQLSVDRARLDVEQARFNLDQAVLKAPFDGIVSNVAVTAGASQGVGASTVVMSVIDPTVMEVLATVDETDVAKLELGMNASVTVEAVGERPYQGKVVAIAPTAKVQSGVVSYQVTLSVARPQGLKAGMTAMANVIYQERSGVLLISSRAIKTNRQERSVQVLVDGKPETRVIKVGLSDDTRTEVLEGLKEGDQVLVQGASVRSNTQNRLPGGTFPGAPGGGMIMPGGTR
ncbi:MAG TPA: efflux RND transporter periplasmic adaptor subunit, partial [Dehalococcoidia bacterium]|nr:efflux RND transporter periplasmic adaptor subunit [Dehalococcoidia bacterium]